MSVLYGAAIIFILLRAVSKMITQTFWMEDYIVVSSTVLAAAPFACMIDSTYRSPGYITLGCKPYFLFGNNPKDCSVQITNSDFVLPINSGLIRIWWPYLGSSGWCFGRDPAIV